MPKYDTLASFDTEYAKLTPEQKRRFRIAVKKIINALKNGTFPPPPLVEKMAGYSYYEVRWAADGRATFEYVFDAVLGEHVIIWRHIGDHTILNHP